MTKKVISRVCFLSVWIASVAWGAQAEVKHKTTLTTDVPFEFVAGNRTLPAGTYTFEMASGVPAEGDRAGVLVIRDVNRHSYVAIATDVAHDVDAQSNSGVMFAKVGEKTFLSQVFQQGKPVGLQLHTPQADDDTEEAFSDPETITLIASSMK